MNVGQSLVSAALLLSMGTIGSFFSFTSPATANPNASSASALSEKTSPTSASTAIDSKTPATSPSAPGAIANPQPAATRTTPEAPAQQVATHLVLDLAQRKVTAYKDNEVLASFPVAVGKKGWETPKGNFKVIQMIKNPTWQNPWNGKVMPAGPNTALGERWIGFWTNGKDTIGFHGTPTVNSIGKAASHGCVRMYNKDVKALFEIVSLGTPVTVK